MRKFIISVIAMIAMVFVVSGTTRGAETVSLIGIVERPPWGVEGDGYANKYADSYQFFSGSKWEVPTIALRPDGVNFYYDNSNPSPYHMGIYGTDTEFVAFCAGIHIARSTNVKSNIPEAFTLYSFSEAPTALEADKPTTYMGPTFILSSDLYMINDLLSHTFPLAMNPDGTIHDNALMGAIQFVIWEIMEERGDNSLSLDTGNFKITDTSLDTQYPLTKVFLDVLTEQNGMTWANAGDNFGYDFSVSHNLQGVYFAITPGDYFASQPFILVEINDGKDPRDLETDVPEPASLLALGIGLLVGIPVVMRRKWNMRRQVAQ